MFLRSLQINCRFGSIYNLQDRNRSDREKEWGFGNPQMPADLDKCSHAK